MKIIAFKRKNDGELFTLNEDKTTYSLKFMKDEFPAHAVRKFFKGQFQLNKFLPIYKED